MAQIVITSGPTRQYLDPVRYITNASSGRMGQALATAALKRGHAVTIVSGPVSIAYPRKAKLIHVVTTQEMLEAASEVFVEADGLIGAAAPSDYQPRQIQTQKMAKTGQPLTLELIETPDVVATLAFRKRPDQWVVGFALETEDRRFRATVKLQKKSCDLMVSNGPTAIDSADNEVEIIDHEGNVLATIAGPKSRVASGIFKIIQRHLIDN